MNKKIVCWLPVTANRCFELLVEESFFRMSKADQDSVFIQHALPTDKIEVTKEAAWVNTITEHLVFEVKDVW